MSPELAGVMALKENAQVNVGVIRDGERVLFKNTGDEGRLGFYDVFQEFKALAERWQEELGREVDIKLKISEDPIVGVDLPPATGLGPILIFRKA